MKIEILDGMGNVINTIVASPEFAQGVYPGRWREAEEDAAVEALPARRLLTHKQFRDRLSSAEQLLLDNFTVAEYAAAEARIQALTVLQRAHVRTAAATYQESQEIDLDDPATVRFVTLLGDLGLLDGPGRAGEILGEGH